MDNSETSTISSTSDPRIPSRNVCVTRYLLERWEREMPDKDFAVFQGGDSWNYRALLAMVKTFAAGLAKQGVRQGDHVAVWMFDSKEAILAFFAINYLGAVFVPFNTAFKGRVLEHVLNISGAGIMVAHAQLLERLEGLDSSGISKLVAVGEAPSPPGFDVCRYADLAACGDEPPELERAIEPWDTQSVIFTSGTTGPSKGVLSSYLHIFTNAGPETWHFVTGEDRFLINMPIFHIGGMGVIYVMLVRGGSIAVMDGFDTEKFWPFVRESETTAFFSARRDDHISTETVTFARRQESQCQGGFHGAPHGNLCRVSPAFRHRCVHYFQHDGNFFPDCLRTQPDPPRHLRQEARWCGCPVGGRERL